MRFTIGPTFGLAIACMNVTIAYAATSGSPIASLDLAQAFTTRSPWRLTATQGPMVEDPTGELAPGAIDLCLSNNAGRSCEPAPNLALRLTRNDDVFARPHFLLRAQVVRPAGKPRLLLLELASFRAGNGDQRVALQLYTYDKVKDVFRLAYAHRTGRNNNQEIRYVEAGPLSGVVITSTPTSDAPFGYWITVDRPNGSGVYRQVLRFRSATTYGDGNPLAVIDSEMPNIQRRLGIWHPGMVLPLPTKACPNPRLDRGALWCD